jgi:hypothetical protein
MYPYSGLPIMSIKTVGANPPGIGCSIGFTGDPKEKSKINGGQS